MKTSAETYFFDEFVLDPADRHLCRGATPIELSGRYLDALALMVCEAGRLVAKDRFLDEVWGGVPVTDEALTQCIKELRKALGDDAGHPRFIETVPKHGYRFIAAVRVGNRAGPPLLRVADDPPTPTQSAVAIGLAASAGGAAAGTIGGLFYGIAAGLGVGDGRAVSGLLVVWLLTAVLATLGGAGVGLGIATARRLGKAGWLGTVGGAAIGGMAVGAFARILGQDALILLFGAAPQIFTGAVEGAMLGAAAGVSIMMVRSAGIARGVALAGAIGALAGAAIVLAGGHILGGSLMALAERFPQARLRLDRIGWLVGENGFGPISAMVTAAGEAALFCACVALATDFATRRWGAPLSSDTNLS